MKIESSLKQVSTLVKGESSLDQRFFIKNLSSLESAGPEDVAVILERGSASSFNEVDRKKIEKSKAGVILSRNEVVPGKPYILVDDPLHALVQLTQFAKQKQGGDVRGDVSPHAVIHEQAYLGKGVTVEAYAVVEKGARVGDYAVIGAGSVIQAHATVGDSTRIYPRVTLLRDCHVGAHTIVHSGAVIGSDGFGYQVTQEGLRKVPHVGSVHIGNHVEIGAGCCIDRATFDATIISDGCKLDNMVHVAHNVTIGASTAILAHTSIGGGAKIGSGCQIGGQVAIKDGVTIGDGAKIVSKSAVTKDIAQKAVVCGQPAQDFRAWKREYSALKSVTNHVLSQRQKTKTVPALAQMVVRVWKRLMDFVRFPRT